MIKVITGIVFGLWFALAPALASTVAVDSQEAKIWANTKGQELLQALSESDPISKYSKLDKMLTEDVNLDYISKFVIGKYARLMNREQQARYSDLFHRYVLSLYKQINLNFDAGAIDFSIDNVVDHPNFTAVNCTVDPTRLMAEFKNLEPQKIPVKFKLIRGASNRIQAVDVEISEVSLVVEYRKQFYRMIRDEDEDMNWFLDKFNDKVLANEKAFYKNAGI